LVKVQNSVNLLHKQGGPVPVKAGCMNIT